MKGLPVGLYFPGNSPVHKLDARIKLPLLLLLLVAAAATETLIGYGLMLAVTAAAVLLSGMPLSVSLASVRRLWAFFLVIFLMNTCFFAGDAPWFTLWILRPSAAGAMQGLNVVLRVLLALVLSNVLTCTTAPMELTGALESLFSPLRYLRIPTGQIALILSAAIGFVPTLFEQTEQIRRAQLARGARFDSRRLRDKAAAVLPLAAPIFLAAFQRADELALAMEARGYRADGSGPRRAQKRLSAAQLLTIPAALALLAIQILFL